MLLELAAANAAFAVIKEAVTNSGELIQAGKAVFDYFDNKSKLQEKVVATPDQKRTDIEEFFALEQLKKQEQELKELFIYQGRPGLWDDWQRFQVQARHKREETAREVLRLEQERKQKRKNLFEQIILGFWLTVLAVIVTGIIIGSAWLYSMKGKF
jgi:anion-transporting  ArsA/GET3 family ATPase